MANAASSAAVSFPLGKNSEAKKRRECGVKIEVVPLEHRAERRREDHPAFLRPGDQPAFRQLGGRSGTESLDALDMKNPPRDRIRTRREVYGKASGPDRPSVPPAHRLSGSRGGCRRREIRSSSPRLKIPAATNRSAGRGDRTSGPDHRSGGPAEESFPPKYHSVRPQERSFLKKDPSAEPAESSFFKNDSSIGSAESSFFQEDSSVGLTEPSFSREDLSANPAEWPFFPKDSSAGSGERSNCLEKRSAGAAQRAGAAVL